MPAGRRRAAPRPVSGTVTQLSVPSGRPERTILYLDGRRAEDIATEVIAAAGLRTGEAVSEEALAALVAQDEPHRARARALRLLSARDRSSAEIRSRLQLAGFSQGTVSGTIIWLEKLGYLDDARFAERYVAEKAGAGWGQRRIRSELLRKGIDRARLDAALESIAGDEAGQRRPDGNAHDLGAQAFRAAMARGSADRRASPGRLSCPAGLRLGRRIQGDETTGGGDLGAARTPRVSATSSYQGRRSP